MGFRYLGGWECHILGGCISINLSDFGVNSLGTTIATAVKLDANHKEKGGLADRYVL